MIEIDELLKDRSIELFDGSYDLTTDLVPYATNKATAFFRERPASSISGIKLAEYSAILEAADCVASVCMLNDRAIKVLVAMYPSAPKYVLVRLAPRLSWFLGVFWFIAADYPRPCES